MRPIRVTPSFTWVALKKLLKTGLPIFGLDYVKSCSGTTDRVALLRFGGVELVGQYALATTAAEALAALPTAVSQYTYPRITHAYGQGETLVALWHRARKAFIVSFLICFGLALVGWQIIEPFVMLVAPRYDSSVPAAKLLMIAAVFESSRIFGNVLLSLKIWSFVTGLQLASAVLLAAGPFMLLWAVDDTLTAVAGGLLVSAVLRAILATTLAYLATHRRVEHRPCDQALASSGQKWSADRAVTDVDTAENSQIAAYWRRRTQPTTENATICLSQCYTQTELHRARRSAQDAARESDAPASSKSSCVKSI